MTETVPLKNYLERKMAASGNITSAWIKFFSEGGIPPSDAANYAIIFTDNRIQRDMLLDLNKEYLNDMGITVMGDIIAILKHAKSVHGQEAREKALKESVTTPTIVTPSRRSTPASRIVDHYLKVGSDPKAAPMNEPPPGPKISKEMASRLGPAPSPTPGSGRSTPTLTKVALQAEKLGEGRYKVTMPKGTTKKTRKIMEDQGTVQVPDVSKSSVFARLGEDAVEPKFTVTGLASSSSSASGSSVFNRLGGTVKRAATSTSPDSDDEYRSSLEYAGVLKSPPKRLKVQAQLPQKKTITVASPKKITRTVPGSRPVTKLPVQTEGILGRGADTSKLSILKRLGKEVKVASASSTTPSIQAKKVPVAAKPPLKASLKARLGPVPAQVSSTQTTSKTGSVFSRLGGKK